MRSSNVLTKKGKKRYKRRERKKIYESGIRDLYEFRRGRAGIEVGRQEILVKSTRLTHQLHVNCSHTD